jgi:hypothetical protein
LSLTPTVRITLAGSFGFLSSSDSDPPFLLAESAQGMSRTWCSDSMTWSRTW